MNGQTYHFISGLPRSGSTLLAALLRQNPRFHAGISGPVGGLFHTLLGEMSARNEFSVFLTEDDRRRILRSVLQAYHANHPTPVVFDTHRSWCTRLPLLANLYPDSKVIACVRDVSWIMDSLERLIRHNHLQPSSIFNYQPGGTVYTRINGLAAPDGMVGYAYDALKEAYFGAQAANRLILVTYESLVQDPQAALKALYQSLGEPWFAHDFEHLAFDADAFDTKAGTPGLHQIHPKVVMPQRQTILPPDLFQRFANDAFWTNKALHPKGVIVL